MWTLSVGSIHADRQPTHQPLINTQAADESALVGTQSSQPLKCMSSAALLSCCLIHLSIYTDREKQGIIRSEKKQKLVSDPISSDLDPSSFLTSSNIAPMDDILEPEATKKQGWIWDDSNQWERHHLPRNPQTVIVNWLSELPIFSTNYRMEKGFKIRLCFSILRTSMNIWRWKWKGKCRHMLLFPSPLQILFKHYSNPLQFCFKLAVNPPMQS